MINMVTRLTGLVYTVGRSDKEKELRGGLGVTITGEISSKRKPRHDGSIRRLQFPHRTAAVVTTIAAVEIRQFVGVARLCSEQ